MRPSFHPRLVNGSFEDPVLFVPFLFENRAILFDLGDIYALGPRDILKISHVFVSHTHMDHFAGFDRLLRLLLGREKRLILFGPAGFIRNVEGKLAGYSWNLVENFRNHFSLQVTEVCPDGQTSMRYLCRQKFSPEGPPATTGFNGILLEEPALTISAVILDHQLPCLGFSIEEKFHVNIIKDRVAALGLDIGPWLKRFKQALYELRDPAARFAAGDRKTGRPERIFSLGELSAQIATITPGQKIAYIADARCHRDNLEKMVRLARGADHLFIEAAFADAHAAIAARKYHLTAAQAGAVAGLAEVKQLTVFHFSPRYSGRETLLHEEAAAAYEKYFGQSIERVARDNVFP